MSDKSFEIIGFITPRYLDEECFKNFTVSKTKTRNEDIPVKVIVENRAYNASKINNAQPIYRELLEDVTELRKKVSDWQFACDQLIDEKLILKSEIIKMKKSMSLHTPNDVLDGE